MKFSASRSVEPICLDDIVSKLVSLEHPGKQLLLHVERPLGARAQREVSGVHA